MTTATFTPTCSFVARGAYGGTCGQPAVQAIHGMVGYPSTMSYQGRCKRHAATERNRRYGALQLVDFTPAILAEMEATARAKAQAAAEVKAQRDREATARGEAYAARLQEEARAPVTYVRKDRDGGLDWEATRAAKALQQDAPHVLLPPIPAWESFRHEGEYRRSSCRVAFETPQAGRPLRIEVSANTLTLEEAHALYWMLGEAIALAQA